MTQTITGGCLCDACRYETAAQPLNIRVCHCHLCQKATGAAFYARVQVPFDSLTITGPVGWYPSSDAIKRGFCPDCGTTLFSRRDASHVIGLSIGSLDEPDRFSPTDHIWVSSKQAWVVIDDGLPQHEGNP